MPVFFGPQGTGKSTIAKIIADMGQSSLAEIDRRSAEWFSDEVMLGDESKELVLSLAGKCLVEIGEMGQRSNASNEHNRAMLSRQTDRGRTAYARAVSTRPRRNVFFGTVNGDTPLQDDSGNRRYLPIAAPVELDLQWLSDNIRQLIGEACTLEAAGVTFAMPRDVWESAGKHQERARAVPPIEEQAGEWFERTGAWYVTATDANRAVKMTGQHGRIGPYLTKLGWKYENTKLPGMEKQGRVWVRGNQHAAVRLVPVQTAVNGAVEMRPVGVVVVGRVSIPPCPPVPW